MNATSGAFLNFHWSVSQPTAPVEKSFKGISGLLTNILEEARSLQNEPNKPPFTRTPPTLAYVERQVHDLRCSVELALRPVGRMCANFAHFTVKQGIFRVPKRNKVPPALKHGVYAQTTILPGEDAEAFEKLHQDLIADLRPEGALEKDTVGNIARLIWRKQNLETLRIAECARAYHEQIIQAVPKEKNFDEFLSNLTVRKADPAALEAAVRQIKKELGYAATFIENTNIATFDGLSKELEIEEKINALIDKSLKRLLLVKGMKSMLATSIPASREAIEGPRKSDDLKAA